MCRSGNVPRTAFATADPELSHRRSTASRLGERGGFIWLERCRANQNKKLWNAFELVGSRPRHRADTGAAAGFGGTAFMQSIRPDNSDPIPLRTSPHRMGTLMIRFIGLLFVAVVILALAWSR